MSNKAAVYVAKCAPLEIQLLEIPKPQKGEILVKNTFVSSNPADWKIQKYGVLVQNFPAGLGFDIAGTVEAVGEGVTRFKKGDRVYAMVPGFPNFELKYSAFQQYTIVYESRTGLTPKNVSDEVAVTFCAPIITAFSALYQDLELPRPSLSREVAKNGKIIYINGGSTSVGAAAIELAFMSGFKIISTSSPKNFDFVKKLGASQVFDYKDPSLLEKVLNYLNGETVSYVFDAEPQDASLNVEIELLNGSGTIATVTQQNKDFKGAKHINTVVTKLYDDNDLLHFTFDFISSALEKGLLFGVKPEIVAHGIEETQKMLDYHASGKVSASKPILKV